MILNSFIRHFLHNQYTTLCNTTIYTYRIKQLHIWYYFICRSGWCLEDDIFFIGIIIRFSILVFVFFGWYDFREFCIVGKVNKFIYGDWPEIVHVLKALCSLFGISQFLLAQACLLNEFWHCVWLYLSVKNTITVFIIDVFFSFEQCLYLANFVIF